MNTIRDTWYMIGRQSRNLLREPIWIAILLVQPMVWLLLYGQLFKNVTRLGGFGTTSYITLTPLRRSPSMKSDKLGSFSGRRSEATNTMVSSGDWPIAECARNGRFPCGSAIEMVP